MCEFIIPGRPITKKNSQRIIVNPKTKRPMVIPSKAYREYEKEALIAIKQQRVLRIEGKVKLEAVYYLPNRRGYPDLVNLLQATCDILEASGVIDNDKDIVSFNGSHVAGIDRDNPRAEITLRAVGE